MTLSLRPETNREHADKFTKARLVTLQGKILPVVCPVTNIVSTHAPFLCTLFHNGSQTMHNLSPIIPLTSTVLFKTSLGSLSESCLINMKSKRSFNSHSNS